MTALLLGLSLVGSFWKPSPSLHDDKLTLTPPDENWSSTEDASIETYPLWNADGATVHLKLSLGAAKGRGYEVYVGFAPEGPESGIQGNGNVVGLSLIRSGTGFTARLSRKEVTSTDKELQGGEYGDFAPYQPNSPVPLAGDSVDLTLKVNNQTVSAQIGDGYTESHPIGLNGKFWTNAHLVVRCKNQDDGRGSFTVDQVSVDCPQQLDRFVQPIDLRSVVNMGFRDETIGDEKGGWTDQGDNDLRNLQTGLQDIHTIPFDVIDPATNGGKSCLMLYSKNRTYFAKEGGPVAVHAKANSLVFLQSAAWAHTVEPAANYEVRYDDGSTVKIPITVGRQIDDWWGMSPVSDPMAGVLLKVKNDNSMTGQVGIYGYRWINPFPAKTIESLTFESVQGDPVVGLLAVSLVKPDIGPVQEEELRSAFTREPVADFKRFPPDADKISDQVTLQTPKTLAPYEFSVASSYDGGGIGKAGLEFPGEPAMIDSLGGISRFPYGLNISFYFWPYSATDWYPTLAKKGGEYGTIERWYYQYGGPQTTLSYQTMLQEYKAKGLKLDLLFNCHSMFDGHDFIYAKTLPEDKMKIQNPLAEGVFNRQNLDAIVRNNATLVDYVIKNGYQNTVAYWEMDNERWDMPGAEYAELVAAHVKMLKAKLPKAKVIVCLGSLGGYSPNPEGDHYVAWSRDLVKRLQELGMNGQIDYFAPHIYPSLGDTDDEYIPNQLDDWSVRNIRRNLDYMSALLDKYGFQSSKFYVSEWGTQSDGLGDASRNDLLTSMAAAIGTAKAGMAIFSYPRMAGSTWHQYGAPYVGRDHKMPIGKWGEQTAFMVNGHGFVTTPPLEAMRMLTEFGGAGKLIPCKLDIPEGVHYLKCKTGKGNLYFVVNSTSKPFSFPVKGAVDRRSLFAPTVLATSILKYGSYGDQPGDVKEILPQEFHNAELPPYSVNLIRASY